MTRKARFEALDILRGITVAFMVMVNNPGSWSHNFAPMCHSHWHGCTATDLVYPFFLFCAGCAMAFSLRKFGEGSRGKAVRKVLGRGAAIFVTGLLIDAFPFFPVHRDASMSFWENYVHWLGGVRVFGVLQRIALSYVIAALLVLWLRKPGRIAVAGCALLVLHTAVLVAFSPAGGAFSLKESVSRIIDIALVGERHVYAGYGIPFDPEGLLGSLTGAASALVGYLAGAAVLRERELHPGQPAETAAAVFKLSLICFASALVLGIWIPVNKPLWTASYVMLAGGWASLALAVISYLTEARGQSRWFAPFKVFGTNALFAYATSMLTNRILNMTGFCVNDSFFGLNEYTSLLWAAMTALFIFALCWPLYHKGIVIKL